MIPVNEPLISRHAQEYIDDCIKTGWVSSAGKYIDLFEEQFARYIGVKHAVTTSSGTAALHLAMAALEIGKYDEVIIPDLTIISCALVVLYTGATPVLADVDPITGTIDPVKAEEKITKRTKAIMVVHLYGHPVDMDPILALAKRYKLVVVEDAAQAHGATYKGKVVGGIGDVGCFSFYANKIITCGEGGMVVTNHKKIAEKVRTLKDLAHSKKRRFFHREIGFNYRMTNLQAALGVAQLEEVERYIQIKRWMAKQYQRGLFNIKSLELPKELPWARSVYWMYAVRVTRSASSIPRDKLCERLRKAGVDTRTFFLPLHTQPALRRLGLFRNEKYPVSSDASNRGFYLPSGLAITKRQIETIVYALKKAITL